MQPLTRQKDVVLAFTLIEFVMVVVLLGIISAVVAKVFISPIILYARIQRISELTMSADSAIYKMRRDILQAVPKSARVDTSGGTSQVVEYFHNSATFRYVPCSTSNNNPANCLPTNDMSFNATSTTAFLYANDYPCGDRFEGSPYNSMSYAEASPASLGPNYRLIIGNTDSATLYNAADGHCENEHQNDCTITPRTNPPKLARTSPEPNPCTDDTTSYGLHKLQLENDFTFYGNTTKYLAYLSPGPVSYFCDTSSKKLYRISGYTEQVNVQTSLSGAPYSTATKDLLLQNVSSCNFTVNIGVSSVDMLSVVMTLTDPSDPTITITLNEIITLNSNV